MVLRSVGIAGRHRRRRSRSLAALTLLPALLAIARAAHRCPPVRRGRARTATARAARRRGRGSPRGSWTDPVAVLVPTLGAAAPARPAVPARPLQRPRRHDPARGRPVAGRLRPARRRVRRGRVRAARRSRSGPRAGDSPGNVAPLYDYSRRLAADPRISRVDSTRGRRPAADRGPVPAALRHPRRAAATGSWRPPRRDDPRRPDRVHRHHPYGPNAPRRARSSATCATRRGPLAPPAGDDGARGRRRGRGRGRRRTGSPPTSRARRCSSS